MARSLSLGGRVLPTDATAHSAIGSGRPGYANAKLGQERIRVYAAPLAEFGGPAAGGAVVVAASMHDLEETLASLHLFVFLAGIIAAALGAGVVALLMRRALRPLGRLATAATEIERTGDPRRRLPQPSSVDEVGQLAGTLNAMLASLERAREGERRFVADASHELRTPLTALRGNVAYIARHGATAAVIAELEQDAERLARLADDLLVLSREETEASIPADEVYLAKRIERGDRAALERAVENLVQNGRRYGPAEGRITIDVESNDGLARITITDEGAGLQPYEAERAFQRFWRGHHGKSGSGIGLAIVRATAERHGGRAYAAGPRFTIELPALRDLSEFDGTTKEESPEKGPS